MKSDEEAIRALVEDWLAAAMAGDVDRVLSHLDEDVRFLLPGSPPLDKEDFAMSQKVSARFDIAIRHEIQEIRVRGDMAWCWNRLEVEAGAPGQPAEVRRAGDSLMILERRPDGWKVLRDANMLSEVKQH